VTDGIILLAKPAGKTSFQALGLVKRALKTGKIGHTGTLDRFAEGLLLALAGRMTRLNPYASGLDKEYVARIVFGKGTDTLDIEGKTVVEGPVPDRESVTSILSEFLGEIQQVPPQYSAVHVGGRRAYEAARRGEEVLLTPKPVTIHKIELLEFHSPEATLRVACSKGTYIRSLARDLAVRLGTCAHVSRLVRIRIGGFRLDEAVAPEQFDPDRHILPPSTFFDRCPGLGRATVKDDWAPRVARGVPLERSSFTTPPPSDGTFGAFGGNDSLLAIVEARAGAMRYAAVLSGTS
jgi:tRNA pseudouridine55 synthase